MKNNPGLKRGDIIISTIGGVLESAYFIYLDQLMLYYVCES